ncbi:hypothetical protein SO802_002715 [Lithocarpus litseifolius]|uniref:RNase H type-1 domain-containing protein n=1 Tax=Lithocarpus litseifolius TaxID=425828 RepID=A0AAW2E3C6_9ROSI
MEKVDFSKSSFWVQIHNLPLSWLTPEVAMEIGESLEDVKKSVDISNMVGASIVHEGIVSVWPVSGSVAGSGTSAAADSKKIMELSREGVGRQSEKLEISKERFQHVNPKLPDIANAINVDYMSSNLLSGKERVKGNSGNLTASRTIGSRGKEISSVKGALQDIGDKVDPKCKSSSESLSIQEAIAYAPTQTESLVQQRWWPPSSQLYKVNVDGVVFKAQRESGVGVIIRDANGLVVAALSKKLHAPLGPLEVEAKAFEREMHKLYGSCYIH